MKTFVHLDQLIPHVDDAFESFYNAMLNDVRLAVFFEDDTQIRNLIQKQKEHFTSSLSIRTNSLKEIYIKLGEYHYDLRIPYVDFIKGTDILEEHFLRNTQMHITSIELMDEIFEYFKLMKAFTAKGYLNRMLEEDKKDIDMFFVQTNLDKDTYLPRAIVLEKIEWLKELLVCIEEDKEFLVEPSQSLFAQWIKELDFLSLDKRMFFEDLELRILINTQNLFYFLKREEYLEILPLYTSLLSIYKLTLMMNNALTIEYANKIIEDMKIDALTNLFRKDIFDALLNKEMASVKRQEGSVISIAYFDLDNFKEINDNFGHYSGDKVLEKMGEIIRKNIRASDMGFRIGGDEFAIIFKNATKKAAKKVCEKIKVDFSAFNFIFNEEITFSVGMSIGISDYSYGSLSEMDDILKQVDNKLYEAKQRGKNQICL